MSEKTVPAELYLEKKEHINVIEDYRWCATNLPDKVLETIPQVVLKEYQITANSMINSFKFWASPNNGPEDTIPEADTTVENISIWASAITKNPWSNLYSGLVQSTYTLPYYATYHHQLDHTWSDGAGAGQKFFEAASAALSKLAVDSSLLKFKKWEGTGEATIPIEFYLFNTVADIDIEKNYDLVRRLVKSNLSVRLNSMMSLPPCIYSVYIPGIRWSPACAVQNFSVENVGQLHYIDDLGNLPDAYKITLNLTELTPEDRRFFDGSKPASRRVEVIRDMTPQTPDEPELNKEPEWQIETARQYSHIGRSL